jgi:hypothetical protein
MPLYTKKVHEIFQVSGKKLVFFLLLMLLALKRAKKEPFTGRALGINYTNLTN